jgi:F-type H+-transporting ATPase subunit a
MSTLFVGSQPLAVVVSASDKTENVLAYILHHVVNAQRWNVLPHVEIPLPPFLSLHGLMVILAAVLLIIFFGVACRRPVAVPTGLGNLAEMFVKAIRDHVVVPYLGEEEGRRMTPFFCTLFAFILMMNLLGLVPGFPAATSNINVTGALAAVVLFIMIFVTMYRNGVGGFFKGFVPPGVPWPVLILLVPIEIIGQGIRAFALTVRLFANMLSGHIVVLALLGLVVVFGYVALPAVVMALGIYVLEVFIAFLQAYIFTLLSAIFIGQRFHPAH